jgi:hypothetical protein
MFDCIISDPGSDLTSDVISQVNKYYGIQHLVGLVDRHESNGVEGTNKQILRHLRALVHDERIVTQWSSPTVLLIIFYLLNSHVSTETGLAPFHAHFGSDEATYFRMPPFLTEKEKTHQFVKLLDENLKILSAVSEKFQQTLIHKRTHNNNVSTQNVYQPGDYVLAKYDPHKPLPTKLSARYLGPYIVLKQTKNDVTVKHLSSGIIHVFHVDKLKRYVGTQQQAKRAADVDCDQYEVDKIIAYKGDPKRRSTIMFEVLYRAGDVHWVPYSKDIFDTIQYEDFCRSTT